MQSFINSLYIKHQLLSNAWLGFHTSRVLLLRGMWSLATLGLRAPKHRWATPIFSEFNLTYQQSISWSALLHSANPTLSEAWSSAQSYVQIDEWTWWFWLKVCAMSSLLHNSQFASCMKAMLLPLEIQTFHQLQKGVQFQSPLHHPYSLSWSLSCRDTFETNWLFHSVCLNNIDSLYHSWVPLPLVLENSIMNDLWFRIIITLFICIPWGYCELFEQWLHWINDIELFIVVTLISLISSPFSVSAHCTLTWHNPMSFRIISHSVMKEYTLCTIMSYSLHYYLD